MKECVGNVKPFYILHLSALHFKPPSQSLAYFSSCPSSLSAPDIYPVG